MNGDYVGLYMHTALAEQGIVPFLSIMFLFMGRVFPIIALAPFFGAKVLPHPVKVTFGLSLFAIFLPQLLTQTTTPLDFNLWLVLYLIKEMFVGLLLGFIISLPFMIVLNAGVLIDHQRGGASLMVNDPVLQNQSSPLGTLFNLVLIYFFFMIDGPFTVINIISESYNILPPDKFLAAAVFAPDSKILSQIVRIMGHVMILSTQLAAPALIMILMTDFFLGIANRLAPQVQITFLGMPLKSLLALLVIFVGWQLFDEEIIAQSYKALQAISQLTKQLVPSTASP